MTKRFYTPKAVVLFSLLTLLSFHFYSCSEDDPVLPGTTPETGISEEDEDDLISEQITSWSSKEVLLSSTVGIYPGASYPASAISSYTFSPEYSNAKQPIDIICDFAIPFVAEDVPNNGSKSYLQVMKEAVNSDGFKNQIKNGITHGTTYQMGEFQSYSQLKKMVIGREDIGNLFADAVAHNSKQIGKVQGRIFYYLMNRNFSVYIETSEPNTFFVEEKYNKQENYTKESDLPVYIRALTYGKVTYAAIESEYSTEELQWAMSLAKEYSFDQAKINANKKLKNILDKSVITAFSPDNLDTIHIPCTLQNFKELITVNYTEHSYGKPILAQFNYVHNNGAFVPNK